MRKIINRRVYNTETSKFLAEVNGHPFPNGKLYVKRNGEFFVKYFDSVHLHDISPITIEFAMFLVETYSNTKCEHVFIEVA